MNIAIIPARSGSRRILAKNVRLFHGKPIIAYSIETARESGLFAEIIVSTDSQDYAALAKAYGAKVHMRPARFCEDNVGTQEVMKVALNWWNVCHPNKPPEYAACIYPCAPLMTADDLRRGMGLLDAAKYSHSAGPTGQDAGAWYCGRAKDFLLGTPLEGNSAILCLPAERVIDVNVEADWQLAERMYANLYHPMGAPA